LNNAAFVKEDYLLRKFALKLFDYKFMSEKDLSYKEAYSRLEQIQRLIEDNQLDVDDLNERLKEVSVLLKICKDKLFLADGETQKILEEIK
jgi:exodeoxyribonuclease VII small subunit